VDWGRTCGGARGIAAAARVPVGNGRRIDVPWVAVNRVPLGTEVRVGAGTAAPRRVCWRSGTGRGNHRVEANRLDPFLCPGRGARGLVRVTGKS